MTDQNSFQLGVLPPFYTLQGEGWVYTAHEHAQRSNAFIAQITTDKGMIARPTAQQVLQAHAAFVDHIEKAECKWAAAGYIFRNTQLPVAVVHKALRATTLPKPAGATGASSRSMPNTAKIKRTVAFENGDPTLLELMTIITMVSVTANLESKTSLAAERVLVWAETEERLEKRLLVNAVEYERLWAK